MKRVNLEIHPTLASVLVAAAVFAATLYGAADASAQLRLAPIQWSVGLKTGGGINFLGPPAIDAEVNPPIPAFVGSVGGIGVAGEALYGDFVGLELDIMDAWASGQGRFIFASRSGTVTVDQELSSRELQIPLLLVGQLPFFRYFKPRLAVGPTFVIQRSTEYLVKESVETSIRSPDPAAYTMLTGGLGLGLVFGKVRVPIDIRFNWNFIDDRPETRGRYVYTEEETGLYLDEITVNAWWQAQVWFLVGVQYTDEVRPW